jgi:hypothetical protein
LGEQDWEVRRGAWAINEDGDAVPPPDLDDTTGGGGSGGGGVDCSGGATGNLISAASFDPENHGEHTLTDSTFNLFVCTQHFPVGSAARAEVEAAAALFNAVTGTDLFITVVGSSHKSIAQLFPASPTSSYMDVVDNSTIGFPCHPAGDILPSSWAMNTCRHGSGGVWNTGAASIDRFVISVNANAYGFDTNPAATDYPKFTNIAHEIGHAVGMDHTEYWTDSAAHEMLSTMQGNLPILPAHDRDYLRHFYPRTAGTTLNLVASSKVRVPDATTSIGWANRDFAAVNPTDLYPAAGIYRDCATQAAPVFQAQWLNHGQVITACTVKNRFRIGPAGSEGSASKITVKNWQGARMPAASQDRIETSVTINESVLASLSKDVAYELTFKVDRDDDQQETTEDDNVVASTITLRDSYWSCPREWTATPLAAPLLP